MIQEIQPGDRRIKKRADRWTDSGVLAIRSRFMLWVLWNPENN